jgi:hypothetical protein
MTTVATNYSRHIGRPITGNMAYVSPGCSKRFRHFIENSDWDEKILSYEKPANKICAGAIIASMVYLVPILLKMIL